MNPLILATREICRRSFYAFVRRAWPHVKQGLAFADNWHIRVICERLEDGPPFRPDGPLLDVINQPPSTMKSLLTGVFWPAWVWSIDPTRSFMYVSFDDSLLNDASETLIALLQSEWYRAHWPRTRLAETAPALSNFALTEGGFRFNTSFGGKGTGRHTHIQVIDDPLKAKDAQILTGVALDAAWKTMADTFASRAINLATFRRVLVMQRLAEDDPAGRALAAGWRGLRLPMYYEAGDDADPCDPRTVEGELLWPARFPFHACEALRTADEEVWATQYQQRPAVPGGQIFQEAWIEGAAILPDELPIEGLNIQSWDLAFKAASHNDHIAGQPWRAAPVGGKMHYFTWDPYQAHRSFVETCDDIRAKRKAWPSSYCLIEDKANGPACEDTLRREMPGYIRLVDPKGSKIGRAHSVAPLVSQGRVHLVRGPGYEAHKRVLSRFPRVRLDDPVDATTQALRDLEKNAAYWDALR